MEGTAEKEAVWRTASKYFLHGILFSGLMLVLAFVWAILFVVLVVAGFIIGLIIGILVLFIIIGGLNNFLTDAIWGIRIKSGWKSLLGHGFILFIVLIVAHIPAIIINLVAPNVVTTVVVLVAYAFIDGFLAKSIAGYWEEEGNEEEP